MPIYEYQCTACAHELEALQKLSDAPLIDCPACAQPQLRKKMSATSFHLKGGGWYQTDFKDTGKKKPAEGAAPKQEGGDAKPATDAQAGPSADTAAAQPSVKDAAGSSAA